MICFEFSWRLVLDDGLTQMLLINFLLKLLIATSLVGIGLSPTNLFFAAWTSYIENVG